MSYPLFQSFILILILVGQVHLLQASAEISGQDPEALIKEKEISGSPKVHPLIAQWQSASNPVEFAEIENSKNTSKF